MIRRFEHKDLNDLLRIEAQAFPKSSYTAEMFLQFHQVLSDTFLVLEDRKVLGYVIFRRDGHVISLAVDPAHRRRGIGRHLMNACETKCLSHRLLVEVREGNKVAQRFYGRLGFRVKSRIPLYYGTEDALIMEKKTDPQPGPGGNQQAPHSDRA
jgi:ribosomal-protein-alanine N-acetyltransferase